MTTYSDEDLLAAAQAAYADLDVGMKNLEEVNRRIKNKGGEVEPFTLENVLEATPASQSFGKYDPLRDISAEQWERIKDWEVIAIENANATTGFYGCAFKTGEGEIIVSFRGSEEVYTEQLKLDWVDADLGLLNSTLTVQQGEAERFLYDLLKMEEVRDANSIAFSGHSLGGNLAQHAAVYMAYLGLADKVSQFANFDGPGVSDEYLKEHAAEIAKIAGKGIHFRWSLVGNLLNALPGIDIEYLQVKPELNPFNVALYLFVGKHATESLIFDENGSALRGDQDLIAMIMDYATRGLDHLPRELGDALVSALAVLADAFASMNEAMFDENGELTTLGWGVVGAIISGVVTGVLPLAIPGLASAALITTALLIGAIVVLATGEFIREKLTAFIEQATAAAIQIGTWATDTAIQIGIWAKDTTIEVIRQMAGAAVQVGKWTADTVVQVVAWSIGTSVQIGIWAKDTVVEITRQMIGASIQVGKWTADTVVQVVAWSADTVTQINRWIKDTAVQAGIWAGITIVQIASWAAQITNLAAQKINGFVQWLADAGSSAASLLKAPAALTVRDFSQAKKTELLRLVNEVSSEWPTDIARWDIWYQAERAAHAALPGLLGNFSQVKNYHRKIIDINNISEAKIQSVFNQVYLLDRQYAASFQKQAASLIRVRKTIESLAASLSPVS
ncbi:MAG: DUF2974 domain-containing protein [Coriobacteriales bacterium]|jgi:uncharacterized membrane protein YeaQ/YmgE (transglycosylase-associated protein family)|nr:DUF2974 domain-containing protein [Coriobacteriales bacterium]